MFCVVSASKCIRRWWDLSHIRQKMQRKRLNDFRNKRLTDGIKEKKMCAKMKTSSYQQQVSLSLPPTNITYRDGISLTKDFFSLLCRTREKVSAWSLKLTRIMLVARFRWPLCLPTNRRIFCWGGEKLFRSRRFLRLTRIRIKYTYWLSKWIISISIVHTH